MSTVFANIGVPGPTGPAGAPGVAYTPMGAWSAVVTYAQGDEVTDASILYISLQSSNLNHTPLSSPTWWSPLTLTTLAQTPWLTDIDAASFNLENVLGIGIGGTTASNIGIWVHNTASSGVTYALVFDSLNTLNSPTIHMYNDLLHGIEVIVTASGSLGPDQTFITTNGTDLVFATDPSSTITTRMRIRQNGLIGIGKFPTTYALEIAGDIDLTTGHVYRINGAPLAVTLTPWTSDIDAYIFDLTDVGALGVGTPTPAHAVDVVGDINCTGAFKVGGVAIAISSHVTQIGTFASLPTSGMTNGDRYMCTDRRSELVYDGTDWQQFYCGLHIPGGTPTALPTFAWRNQGTAFVVAEGGGTEYLTATAASGNNVKGREINFPPGGTPWTLTVTLHIFGSSQQFNGAGIYLSDGTKLILLTVNPLAAVNVNQYSSASVFSSTPLTAANCATGVSNPVALRITDNGTNHIFGFSADGVNFTTVTQSRTAYITTVTKAGYYAEANHANWAVGVRVVDWKVT